MPSDHELADREWIELFSIPSDVSRLLKADAELANASADVQKMCVEGVEISEGLHLPHVNIGECQAAWALPAH